jgi:hypothetical protein
MKATSATIGREKDTKPGTRTSTTCAGIGCKNSFNSGIFVMLKKLSPNVKDISHVNIVLILQFYYIDDGEILRFPSEIKTCIPTSKTKKFISLCYIKVQSNLI